MGQTNHPHIRQCRDKVCTEHRVWEVGMWGMVEEVLGMEEGLWDKTEEGLWDEMEEV